MMYNMCHKISFCMSKILPNTTKKPSVSYICHQSPELGKYRIAIRYLRILDISTIRRHE